MNLFEPLILTLTVGFMSWLLLIATLRINSEQDNPEQNVINAINDCLPQTQCAQCGHPGCLPYAQAIVAGEPINRCPPGGEQTIQALANLLGRQATQLDPQFGEYTQKRVAVIRESECIGCTLCIQACPVDAIIGAQQVMHSVISDACTGCDLCLPPCPVDCIDMVPVELSAVEPKLLTPLVAEKTSACIRCGDCETVCPKALSPQNLHWHQTSPENLTALKLDDCIECRLCDRVCPSAIPLTEQFIAAKLNLAQIATEKVAAEVAEQRYEKRKIRLIEDDQAVKTKPSSNDRKALLARLRK